MRPDRFGRGAGRRPGRPFDRTTGRLHRLADGFDVDPRDDGTAADVIPFGDGTGLEPELAALAGELETAGARARRDDPALGGDLRPAPAFAADLRSRLLAQLPAAGPSTVLAAASATAATRADRPVPHVPSRVTAAPQVRSRLFDQIAAPRWTALAAAAVIVVAALGLSSSRPTPDAPASAVSTAIGATIERAGSVGAASAGMALLAGDTIAVGDGGSAVLTFGASETRLAAGAIVRVSRIDPEGIRLVQLAGRAYHRVDVPAGDTYVVQTASVEWTARGTAFDLDREALAGSDGDRVTLLAIQHGVAIHGPAVDATVGEGRRAVVILGGEVPDVSTAAVPADALRDPWLIANARIDRAQARPLGILAGIDLGDADPSVEPTSPDDPGPTATTGEPSLEPGPSGDGLPAPSSGEPSAPPISGPSPDRTPEPTPRPTPRPTPTPTHAPEPTPLPTATPSPATIGLSAIACDGGVVLDWTPYAGDGFDRAVVLRSATSTIPATWPPSGGAVAVDGATTANPALTDGIHSTPDGVGTVYYRALVLDAANRVLAKSSVRSAVTHATESLGTLAVTPDAGSATFGWREFFPPSGCFTTWRLVWSAENADPSFLGANDGSVAVSGSSTTGTTSDAFGSGTFHFRVQAIRVTSLGSFVAAETGVTDAAIP